MASDVFTVRRRDLAWALALMLLLSLIWVARSDWAAAGSEPPGEGIDVVYVAVGTGFADALGVGPGAAMNSAPIIIVPTSPPLDAATEAELLRLDPRHVIIVGGTNVVSPAMEAALSDLLPNASFGRIAGTNRYRTNADFSAANYPVLGWASVSAPAFNGLDPDDDIYRTGTATYMTFGAGELMAGIQLPHNARIIALEIHGSDIRMAVDISVVLRRANNVTQEDIAAVSSSDAPGAFEEFTGGIDTTRDVVDNQEWGYLVYVSGAGYADTHIAGVRVLYQLGNPDPAISPLP